MVFKYLFSSFLFFSTNLLANSLQTEKFDHSYSDYNKILQSAVIENKNKTKSLVNYKKIDKKKLNKILIKLLKPSHNQVYKTFTYNQRLSYFINLYNILTLQLIKNNYEKIKTSSNSIKSLRKGFPFFTSPWKQKNFNIFNKKSSLDEIEHGHIRGVLNGFSQSKKEYKDPRIHFAVNCASIGCPALSTSPFISGNLYEKLQLSLNSFLKDRTYKNKKIDKNKSRNYVNLKEKTVYISKIFDWYKDDFKKGFLNTYSLKDFLVLNTDSLADSKKELNLIKSKNFQIKYTDYNWSLNDSF